jgi:hypothetical protein
LGGANAVQAQVICKNIGYPGGSAACRTYAGSGWTQATVMSDCAVIPGGTAGTPAFGESCAAPVVGTCITGAGTPTEARTAFLSGPAEMLSSYCVGGMAGIWVLPIAGSCNHGLVFGPPGTPAMNVCTQYSGSNWTGTSAQNNCASAPKNGTYSASACTTSTIGFCTLGQGTAEESAIHFYQGNASQLKGGCETPPPYGFGGVWTGAVVGPTLDPAVVTALQSDATVTVSPANCVTDACMGQLYGANGGKGAAIFFEPADGSATKGLILYPGGMVEPRAYAVAAHAIAAMGYAVALVPFPNKLAITDPMRGMTAALLARPWINQWAIAGHSLGGVSAALLAQANPMGNIQGLAMWASYPAIGSEMPSGQPCDLSATGLKAISIIGTEDGGMDWEQYEARKALMPAATYYLSMRGANHAQFGYYGNQNGDKPALISRESQHELFVGATAHLMARLGVEAQDDVIDPIYEVLDDYTDYICANAQVDLAKFKPWDLNTQDIVNETIPSRVDFGAAKPGFPTDGSGLVSVKTYVHQVANPDDISSPPILDGEVWCKMKTQEAIKAQYGFKTKRTEGDCADLNKLLYNLLRLETALKDPELAFLYLWSGTQVDFVEDFAATMGPEWLSHNVVIAQGTDEYTHTVQASKLRTAMEPGSPYAGNYYCKLWDSQTIAKFIVNHADPIEF